MQINIIQIFQTNSREVYEYGNRPLPFCSHNNQIYESHIIEDNVPTLGEFLRPKYCPCCGKPIGIH